MNSSSINQSIERSSNGGNGGASSANNNRTRNKKQHLTHNLTMAHANQYNQALKGTFDGNFMDLNNFKSTQSVATHGVVSNQTQVISGASFNIPNKNNSATNTTAAMMNQNNILMLKQQILAHKKASNLLMKGNSPQKKANP